MKNPPPQPKNMIIRKITPNLSQQQSVDATCGIDFKLFKLFLQSQERPDLIHVIVTRCEAMN